MEIVYAPSEQLLHGGMHLIRDEAGKTLADLGCLLVFRLLWPLRDAAWFVLTGEPPDIITNTYISPIMGRRLKS
jgi:hypothetical protein